MTTLSSTLESVLAGTRRRHKWLRFLRYLAFLGIAVAVMVLVLGVVMTRGWLTTPRLAVALFGVVFALATLVLPALALVALLADRSREWSAGKVEDANPTLLDRLHTLVFLGSREEHRVDPSLQAYGRRIEKQAVREMTLAAAPLADERRKTRRLWLGLFLLVAATGLYYARFHPLDRLRMGEMWDGPVFPEAAEDPFGAAPLADAAELQEEKQEPAWGEIRITEPGRDLKVTKVDVVPLQIEAATSRPLTGAGWVTTLTGAEPEERPLPPPEEPRFAIYKPYFYVDEMGLADWDVVTYYARASTAADEYASEVYFLEVRPFREEIEKLMGGGGGGGWMNQASALIERQKHVLRQTHRFLARGAADEDVRRQDREKLVEAEADLGEAVGHLYAQMAAELEHHAIADVLDHLALAEEELDRATAALAEAPATAPEPEQKALAELVATRKSLQRAISEDPGAFNEKSADIEPFPIAADRVKQISEFRDEEKAARELLEETLEEQRRIGQACESAGPGAAGRLAGDQEASRRRLEQFAGDHPRLFEEAREATERADRALASVRDALEQLDPDLASERQGEALSALETLRDELEEGTARRQLKDAYELKKLLDRQAEKMGEIESSPGGVPGEQAGRTAEAAKETTRELKELVEESPVGEGFGPGLHEALSDARQAARERSLDALGEAGPAERSRAAERARRDLEQVSDAFEESAPRLVRELREEDALSESDGEALANAIRLLEALRASPSSGSRSPADATRRREALLELRRSLDDQEGDSRRVAALLEEAEEALEHGDEVDPAKLARLLDELERFRTELGGVEVEKVELDLAHIDPATLPAEYRERIQSYFRRLSEER